MAKHNNENRLKQAIQLTILGVILILLLIPIFNKDYLTDFEAYCPFGGILALGSKSWMGSLSCQMSETQIFMGLALIVGVIFFGKLFCSYICPIGTVIEWLQKGAKKLGFTPVTLRGWLDLALRPLKYLLLYITAYYTVTSSELFCKKFDPYYALVTGFDSDVNFWWAIIAILIAFVGSVIIRFFWCKYLCPLAALSNIAANAFISIPILAIFLVIRWAGYDLHVAWLIGALTLSGALTESLRFKFYNYNPFKITVREPQCTHCKLCDLKCPQGIEVNKYEQVDHPDCTLCMDCVKTCPKEGGLTFWKFKGTWQAPAILVGLIILALVIARNFEFATLSERWGAYEKMTEEGKTVAAMEMKSMRSIKCFGAAKSLQAKLSRTPAIVGLDAYAKGKRAIIYYDPARIDSTGIRRVIFTPSKYKIQMPANGIEKIDVLQIGVYELFDGTDNFDLYYMLQSSPAVYAFKTQFGEPVMVDIFYNGAEINGDAIREIIGSGKYEKESEGKKEIIKVEFEPTKWTALESVSVKEYILAFFPKADRSFNEYEKYSIENLRIFEFGMPEAANSRYTRQMSYYISHMSEYDGVVRFRTDYTDKAIGQVYFDPAQVDSLQVVEKIKAAKMKVFLKDGSTREFDNPFTAEEPFRIISAQ
jgi:polyferredoxin